MFDTGATFKDVPITITRSTSSRSCPARRSSKVFGRASPKKVMSGLMSAISSSERTRC